MQSTKSINANILLSRIILKDFTNDACVTFRGPFSVPG